MEILSSSLTFFSAILALKCNDLLFFAVKHYTPTFALKSTQSLKPYLHILIVLWNFYSAFSGQDKAWLNKFEKEGEYIRALRAYFLGLKDVALKCLSSFALLLTEKFFEIQL